MKKLIISLAVLAASISGAHAAETVYKQCRVGMIMQDGTLSQTKGQFAVVGDSGNQFSLTVIDIYNISAEPSALISPKLDEKMGNVNYGDNAAGRFIKAKNGNYAYMLAPESTMAIDNCEVIKSDSLYVKKLQKAVEPMAKQMEEMAPPVGGTNYYCEEGSKANRSDDKKVFTLTTPNGEMVKFKILKKQPVDFATSYELEDTVMQVADIDEKTVHVNFGHGSDFECTKTSHDE
ncbi:hypothetical protein NAD41_002341 [Salmonella enterica]|nr:hypothetical protein [Salmonella enterica]EKK6596309.1 hypothetical protein [Salmonella enterica]